MFMKKFYFALAIIFSMAFNTNAQTGTWSGFIENQGHSLKLQFNISDGGCTLDVPQQRALGIPTQMEKQDGGKIIFKIPDLGIVVDGTYDGEKISGTFTQHSTTCPLTLKQNKRPQTPVGPFPYTCEDVEFTNGDAILSGTLTLPEKYTKETPVVIMITGSGLQDRDETLYSHKPFAVIADYLARNGIASLRYDDRGFAKSTGSKSYTIDDSKNDALAGIQLLRERFTHVGIVGHSEGGTIALMIAAEGKADFIVSMAGMAISGKETLLVQNRHALLKMGFDKNTVDTYITALSEAFTQAATTGAMNIDVEKYELPAGLKQNLRLVASSLTPNLKSLITLDISGILSQINCPVLALNGKSDTQVDADKNISLLQRNIKNGICTTTIYSKLNHLFQHCESGEIDEYEAIEETISPEVLEDIVQWMKKDTGFLSE